VCGFQNEHHILPPADHPLTVIIISLLLLAVHTVACDLLAPLFVALHFVVLFLEQRLGGHVALGLKLLLLGGEKGEITTC
jgi:hypothetical protein